MNEEQKIKDRDAAARQKMAENIYKNAPAIFGGIVLMAVVGAGVWAYGYYEKTQNVEARAELYRLEAKITAKSEALFEEATKGTADQKEAKLPEIPKTPESFRENYAELARALESAILERQGTEAALVSAMFLANFYTDYGLSDKALKLLQSLEAHNEQGVVASLAQAQMAALLSGLGQCEAAIGIYEGLEANAEYNFMLPELLIRKTSCLIEVGRNEEAQATIDTLRADHDKTEAARTASVYERLLQLNQREQNL